MRVLDLFSGIGGFSLGLERAGFETVAFCEIDPFCRSVLKKHWPDVPCYEDVTTLTGDALRRDGIAVDVICGGFPCQDVSFAGKRAGLEGARSGLWSEYARIIGEVRPRFVIAENVPGLLSLGMGRVLRDLSALGYDATWDCIPACAVGAPHRRDRVWIVAHSLCSGHRQDGVQCAEQEGGGPASRSVDLGNAADAFGDELREQPGRGRRTGRPGQARPREHGQARAVADADKLARHQGRSSDAAQGAGRRDADRSAKCSALRHADDSRLALGQGEPGDHGEELAPAIGADWWLSEPDVCGMVDGFSSRLDGEVNAGQGMGTEAHSSQDIETRLRDVWEYVAARAASQGSRSDEQLASQLADRLPELSHALALGGGEGSLAAALRFVRRLREACEAAGAVRDASDPIAETWQSASREEADCWFMAACGRTDWGAGEWAGVGRVAVKVPARVDRLKALGNAVVPQIPELIGRAILEAAA